MTNELTPQEVPDDGLSGSITSGGHLNKGAYLKWTDLGGCIDRDGLTPPPMLVLAVDTALQKWKDNKPEVIRDKPLPDPEQLNAAIPKNEWEKGHRRPIAHAVGAHRRRLLRHPEHR